MQLAFEFQDRGAPATEPGLDDLECWRPIPGKPGFEISDWGRVQSYWVPTGNGRKWRIGLTPRLHRGTRQSSGHLKVSIKGQGIEIQVLVLEAFVGPRPSGKVACHIDGNPANNRLYNLRWATRAENQQDMVLHGRQRSMKLTVGDVCSIWKRLVLGEKASDIARDYGMDDGTIGGIKTGQYWSFITSKLPGWPIPREIDPDTAQSIYIPALYSQTLEEIWKPIVGWPPYRISNFGRVQTCLMRIKGVKSGRHVLTDQWRDRVLSPQHYGHLAFLAYFDGRSKTLKAHVCVLEAFACSRPKGMVACHNDGNPGNNHASNLRWDSQKANCADAVRHRRPRPPE